MLSLLSLLFPVVRVEQRPQSFQALLPVSHMNVC